MSNERDEERDHAEVLSTLISALTNLEPDVRRRLIDTVCTFFSIGPSHASANQTPSDDRANGLVSPPAPRFTAQSDLSPKQFLLEKMPKSDIERVACLAYFLVAYMGVPTFKTVDISKVNTEAAQPKFSNAAYAVSNAVRAGFLADAGKGQRQLSAMGEQFVLALPDRNRAKEVVSLLRKRSKGPMGGKRGTRKAKLSQE
jgi:hypothetical protein